MSQLKPVVLQQPHTHAGRQYPAGATLNLRPAQAEWLIALGVGVPAPAPAKKEK